MPSPRKPVIIKKKILGAKLYNVCMTQKVIQIGSSAGVTIPKKQLKELGIRIGDEIEIEIKPKTNKYSAFMGELEKFMDTYDQDLKNLAKR